MGQTLSAGRCQALRLGAVSHRLVTLEPGGAAEEHAHPANRYGPWDEAGSAGAEQGPGPAGRQRRKRPAAPVLGQDRAWRVFSGSAEVGEGLVEELGRGQESASPGALPEFSSIALSLGLRHRVSWERWDLPKFTLHSPGVGVGGRHCWMGPLCSRKWCPLM